MKESVKIALRSIALGVILAVSIAGLVFALSGVWPPLVSVVSGSMEPHISQGDLVLVKDVGKYEENPAIDTHRNSDKMQFGMEGDVIVFSPNGGSLMSETHVIHRAMFKVDKGDNWYQTANKSYIPPYYNSCESLPNCPAPNSGYITKGDANDYYDQAQTDSISKPVKESWVKSEAMFVVPLVGYLRIFFPLVFVAMGIGLVVLSLKTLISSSGSEEIEEDESIAETET